MKLNIQSSRQLIRSMLDGKSYREAREQLEMYRSSMRVRQTRKDFHRYGTDLSAYSDEEIERFTTYISRIMDQRSGKDGANS